MSIERAFHGPSLFDQWRENYELFATNDDRQKHFFDEIAKAFPEQA